MAKLNGSYEYLRLAGKTAIDSFYKLENQSWNLGAVVRIDSKSKYTAKFSVYEIEFEARVELLTDCEKTKIGHIRLYIVEIEDDKRTLKPFNLFPCVGENGVGCEFIIHPHKEDGSSRAKIEYIGPDGMTTIKEPVEFGFLLGSNMTTAVAESKLPIPLDLLKD